jgi:predicted transcriptional regulator
MSESSVSSGLAAQTLAEIAEIDRRIASLIELRDGLKRVFMNASGRELGESPGTEPVESRRSMMEHVILEMLEKADDCCLKTRELFAGARAISAHLKYVTFRSQLHRLKQRGLITTENAGHGSWRLARNTMRGRHDRSASFPQ